MQTKHTLKLNLNKNQWWQSGVRFECQGSGNCCTSHGEYGFVYLTPEDRRRFAEYFKISMVMFTKKYCDRTDGVWHLKEDSKNPNCMFLRKKRCSVYEARPEQCRTWPFWPEVMNAKIWNKDVATFCPGVGKGKRHSGREIEKSLREQVHASKKLGE